MLALSAWRKVFDYGEGNKKPNEDSQADCGFTLHLMHPTYAYRGSCWDANERSCAMICE